MNVNQLEFRSFLTKMPKARVKARRTKKGKEMESKIGDIMQNLLQMDRNSNDFSSINVVLQKYKRLRDEVNAFLKNLLQLFTDINSDRLNAQTLEYKRRLITEYRDCCKLDTAQFDKQLDIINMPVHLLKELRNKYLDLKESFLVLTSIMISNNISSYKIDGGSLNKLERYDDFCRAAMIGDTELRLFNFIKIGEQREIIDFDFVVIFDKGNISCKYSPETKRTIFETIINLRHIGRNIGKICNDPDIDVADIFPKILDMIEVFKGQLHGCDRAFDIIRKSSGIFERNCNKYIKKATTGGNPMCMFTEFIEDIIAENASKISESDGNSNTSATIIMELKKIIKEIRQNIERALRSTNEIPDNIKFVLDAAEVYIEEFENESSGELPNIQEIRKLQQNFKDIFIP